MGGCQVKAALEFGYTVTVQEPETPWKLNAEELFKRNSHGVPKEKICAMLNRWEPNITVDDIINAKRP